MRLCLIAAVLLQVKPAPPRPVPELPLQRFIDDMRSKNLKDVLALYAPTVAFVDPSGKAFGTPKALRQLYVNTFATYDSSLALYPVGVNLKGDPSRPGAVVVQNGNYSEDFRIRTTKVVNKYCGTYTISWVHQEEHLWLITRMEWTSNPCAAPAVK